MPRPRKDLVFAPPDGEARMLHAIHRYGKSTKFQELCAKAARGDKYTLDDELEVIRGMLGMLVEKLSPEEDVLEADRIFLELLAGTKFSKPRAKLIVKAVNAYGSTREIATVLKELRETLKQAAIFEQMLSVERVQKFVAAALQVMAEEAGNEDVRERAGKRIRAIRL